MKFDGQAIKLSLMDGGIAKLCFDLQGESVNKFNQLTLTELGDCVDSLQKASGIEGLLLTARALRALQGRDAADEVEDLLVQAAEKIDETGAQYFRAELHLEAAEIARLRGDEGVAEREFARASEAYAERGASAPADRAAAQSSSRSAPSTRE